MDEVCKNNLENACIKGLPSDLRWLYKSRILMYDCMGNTLGIKKDIRN